MNTHRGSARAASRLMLLGILVGNLAIAQDIPGLTGAYIGGSYHCTATADLTLKSCYGEVEADINEENAVCTNESDYDDRAECFADVVAERDQDTRLCGAQHAARKDLCRILGESRYDPEFEEELFESEFDPLVTRNPWFPLQIGNLQKFEGDETVEIEVLDQLKLIDDVTCVVVRDRVFEDGVLVEDTNDWFGQALNGDVWYCGEEVKDYEVTEGDDPAIPELVSIDGSFKHDVDGAKAGIQFLANPLPGSVYRQEFAIGIAEDAAEILTRTYRHGASAELDRHVPADLARLLCQGDCVVVREFSPMSPGGNERKYYARGIGLFLNVHVDSGSIAQLTECNYDARCSQLPQAPAR